ncbi:MAG: glycosyltransferase [Flavobacteriaceae bacterium]|nr:glycosyltransferase [Flavobacteriaceae bacterium]
MLVKERFLKKYQKEPVEEVENTVSKTPMVSVLVQTYNQEKFIANCLDGILMQKTNFDIEIMVGEDGSSDNTREICLKYAKQYPDKVRLFLHSRANNIRVYGKPTSQFNFKYNTFNSRGKYVAICEGDDYWTDDMKLQKQVDFLESNPDYGLIYSNVNLVDEFGKFGDSRLMQGYKTRYNRIKHLYKSGDIFWTLLEKNLVNTLTTCFHRYLLIDYFENFLDEDFVYDLRLWLHMSTFKKVHFENETWGHYRVLGQGISNSNGFFDKRKPLVKQSALLFYLKALKHNSGVINDEILVKTVYFILKAKALSLNEKIPTIGLLLRKPQYLFKLINYKMKKKLLN